MSAATTPVASAILTMRSVPSSRVVLDGKLLGETPVIGIAVSPGEHNVRFVHHEHGTRTMRVVVQPGESKTAAVRF
jgi:hypothetical protein